MSNPLKDLLDKQQLQQEITERENLIAQYYKTCFLDRETAIHKIQELRLTNKYIAEITTPKVLVNSVPFSCATDDNK